MVMTIEAVGLAEATEAEEAVEVGTGEVEDGPELEEVVATEEGEEA